MNIVMRMITLILLLIAPSELLAQEGKDNFLDSVIICEAKQALGLPTLEKYYPGFKPIQELPSEGEYVLKPLKNIMNMAELTNNEIGGFYTHKYSSKGSIIRYNDDSVGICWVNDLESKSLSCHKLLEDYDPSLEVLESGDLRSKLKKNQILNFIPRIAYAHLEISEGRFMAINRTFRDCDNVICSKRTHVLMERGTCSVY